MESNITVSIRAPALKEEKMPLGNRNDYEKKLNILTLVSQAVFKVSLLFSMYDMSMKMCSLIRVVSPNGSPKITLNYNRKPSTSFENYYGTKLFFIQVKFLTLVKSPKVTEMVLNHHE